MTKEEQRKKAEEYAALLTAHIAEIFEEESENFINEDDFKDSDKLTAFITALTVIMPRVFYKELTGDNVDSVGFTHIANRLAFQVSIIKKDGQ